MAKKDAAWSRFRDKENQREDDLKKELNEALGESGGNENQPKDGQKATREMRDRTAEQNPILKLITRADLALEQIQHLYNMYVAGVEKVPPLSQRKQLEDLLTKLMNAPKNNQTILFRVNQFQTKYATYRDRWERLAKDIEAGKVIVRKAEKPPPRF